MGGGRERASVIAYENAIEFENHILKVIYAMKVESRKKMTK